MVACAVACAVAWKGRVGEDWEGGQGDSEYGKLREVCRIAIHLPHPTSHHHITARAHPFGAVRCGTADDGYGDRLTDPLPLPPPARVPGAMWMCPPPGAAQRSLSTRVTHPQPRTGSRSGGNVVWMMGYLIYNPPRWIGCWLRYAHGAGAAAGVDTPHQGGFGTGVGVLMQGPYCGARRRRWRAGVVVVVVCMGKLNGAMEW